MKDGTDGCPWDGDPGLTAARFMLVKSDFPIPLRISHCQIASPPDGQTIARALRAIPGYSHFTSAGARRI